MKEEIKWMDRVYGWLRQWGVKLRWFLPNVSGACAVVLQPLPVRS